MLLQTIKFGDNNGKDTDGADDNVAAEKDGDCGDSWRRSWSYCEQQCQYVSCANASLVFNSVGGHPAFGKREVLQQYVHITQVTRIHQVEQ